MNAKQNSTTAAQKNVNTSFTYPLRNKKKSAKVKSPRGMCLRKEEKRVEV
jgi:hypothetical protein